MKIKRILTVTAVLALVLVFAVNLCGCGVKPPVLVVKAGDLMDGVVANRPERIPDIKQADSKKLAGFALKLFMAAQTEGENTLVSPVSVLAALAMTANGARNNTLKQMEKAFGLDLDDLNSYFLSFLTSVENTPSSELEIADSIWIKDSGELKVAEDFLQKNADYYGADAYSAPFDDQTLDDINGWVSNKTHGMIPEILDEIPKDALMYLVNALAFEAKWAEPYLDTQIHKDEFFRCDDGVTRTVDFMVSKEHRYVSDGRATGFIKPYEGGRYAFAALLPDEGLSVSEYLKTLDGDALYKLITKTEATTVFAEIPKFESKYGTELSGALKNMGMTDAFDGSLADFGGIGEVDYGNLYIGRVLHKTFISVDEKGTKAGAATVVEVPKATGAFEEPKRVVLDRPFVYMLIDMEANVPLFIGTMMDVGA